MKQNSSFLFMAFPLTCFILIGIFLFVQRTGIIYGKEVTTLNLLGNDDQPVASKYSDEKPPACLILNNSQEEEWKVYYQTIQDALDSMRIKCDIHDISSDKPTDVFGIPVLSYNQGYDLKRYQNVIITFREGLSETQYNNLINWMGAGGRVLFSYRPDDFDFIQRYQHELGIKTFGNNYIFTTGVRFTSDFMPGVLGVRLPQIDLGENESLYVSLDEKAHVHITSDDLYQIPLLWDYDYGKGRVVFINTGQFNGKYARGTVAAAYNLLQDTIVYPVINSSVFFIDDYPSPIPEEQDLGIYNEYRMDMRDFYQKVWWPDMYALVQNYGICYTTVLIETYAYTLQPPFSPNINLDDYRYFGGYLLKSGGQIGIHGYNHVPLCLALDGANQLEAYPSWVSVNNMKDSLTEVFNFAHTLYSDRLFTVYVPPSNVLCSDMRAAFAKNFPEIKVISSLYESDENTSKPYLQEFSEAPDGIIELPRISSEYWMNDDNKWTILNELSLHYVFSHFVHPDDVLDGMCSANKPWNELYKDFDQFIKWEIDSAPGIRQMDANEGGAAVQRFARLKVNQGFDSGVFVIELGNFYDEAWLMLRSVKKPTEVSGGTISEVTSSLYLIHATQPEVRVEFEEVP